MYYIQKFVDCFKVFQAAWTYILRGMIMNVFVL